MSYNHNYSYIDFRASDVSGSSVRAYDRDGVKVSIGHWVTVELHERLRFKFDREDFPWRTHADLDHTLVQNKPELIEKMVLEVACSKMRPRHFIELLALLLEEYARGKRHGEVYKIQQIKECLEL